jgi:hypothetical protein
MVQVPRKDLGPDKQLKAQGYRCATCLTPIKDVNFLGMRQSGCRHCHYSERYYCSKCHTNERAELPDRLLSSFDGHKYKVSAAGGTAALSRRLPSVVAQLSTPFFPSFYLPFGLSVFLAVLLHSTALCEHSTL